MTWQRLILGLAWVFFALAVLMRQDASSLIMDWVRPLVIGGTALLFLLVIGAWIAGRKQEESADDPPLWAWVGRCGIHLLPLYLVSMVGIGELGSSSVGTLRAPQRQNTGIATPAPEAPFDPFLLTEPRSSWSGGSPASRVLPPRSELGLLDLYYPLNHPGVDHVTVIGKYLTVADAPRSNVPLPDDLDAIIYRHMMICCAADASPVPVGIRDARPEPRAPLTFAKDAWVSVHGRWLPPLGDNDLAVIEIDAIRTIKAPSNPYLSPMFR